MNTEEIKVLDKGFVSLEASCADDLSVVNAARVSYHKYHFGIQEGDDQLIRFLLQNRHGTPFEQNFFRFRVKAPIFVFREWHRHRIGISINEWSARYSELKDDFYIPTLDHVRTQVGKPGNYYYEAASKQTADWFIAALTNQSEVNFLMYKEAIDRGVAKEQARFFLPVNIYSEMYWCCNARSLMNFLSLRNHDKAMWEIREYAKVLEDIFRAAMPITHDYFVDNKRIAP